MILVLFSAFLIQYTIAGEKERFEPCHTHEIKGRGGVQGGGEGGESLRF